MFSPDNKKKGGLGRVEEPGQTVLFRLVSTELLEGDFYTCADTKRDTQLAKRALLEEKQEKHLGR
jgi:hypothetical protein